MDEPEKVEKKIGYVRVSRDEQDPSSQIKLMQDLGIAMSDIFVDAGISGWTDPTVRPVYKKLLARLDQEPKVTEIIFSEFSRLGRDAKGSIFELISLQRKGIHLQSLSEHEKFLNNIPDPWQGQILYGMMVGAEIERKHHIERTRWAMNLVKERGSKSGKPVGRPEIPLNMDKIKETMEKYHCSERVAAKICGYNLSTFYAKKKKMKEHEITKKTGDPE